LPMRPFVLPGLWSRQPAVAATITAQECVVLERQRATQRCAVTSLMERVRFPSCCSITAARRAWRTVSIRPSSVPCSCSTDGLSSRRIGVDRGSVLGRSVRHGRHRAQQLAGIRRVLPILVLLCAGLLDCDSAGYPAPAAVGAYLGSPHRVPHRRPCVSHRQRARRAHAIVRVMERTSFPII